MERKIKCRGEFASKRSLRVNVEAVIIFKNYSSKIKKRKQRQKTSPDDERNRKCHAGK